MMLRAASRAVLAVGLVATGCITDPGEPPLPPEPISLASVVVGGFHACGLDAEGRAYCWGGNGAGQLGRGDQEDQFFPTAVTQGQARFRRLFAGATHTCALSQQNELWCWGSNTASQLGTGTIGGISPTPMKVEFTGGEFIDADAGDLHTCALTSARDAYCWGAAESGQLGNGVSGGNQVRASPQLVLGGLAFERVSAGGTHSCGVTPDAEAYCWGGGTAGQLGTGNTGNSAEPVAVSGGLLFQQIHAGAQHACGVTLEGGGYCWGLNDNGQLGTGSNANTSVPTAVAGGLTFVAISTGGSDTCGLTTERDAYCWGLNSSGELGDGTTTSRNTPVPVAGAIKFSSVHAASGLFTTASCGRGLDGIVYCWGFGGSGQVGDGTANGSLVPVRVARQKGTGGGAIP